MYKDLDEQELARLCRNRDRLAEEELYTRYAARLLTLCRRYIGDPDEANDVMQDSVIKTLDRISTFKYSGKGSLYAWLRKVTLNHILDVLRRKRLKFKPLDSNQGDDVPEPDGDGIESIPREELMGIISRLPEMRRTIFNLYCIEGYSHKDIGRMLGISEKGSASALAKARNQLKAAINEYLKTSG